jgi:hypothetical protein
MDIDRSAIYIVKEYGEGAATFVARWSDYLLEKGDVHGQRKWLRILKAIEDLSSTERGDATLH